MTKDTPEHVEDSVRTMMMERTGAERMAMGCSMYDAAKAMARASLAHLPEQDVRIQLFERFYGSEFDEKASTLIITRTIRDCPISCIKISLDANNSP